MNLSDYWVIGAEFCAKINSILAEIDEEMAFVTGGGYAYSSIKYSKKIGDFDFMIIYKSMESVNNLLEKLKELSGFVFVDKYLNDDLNLLYNGKIDIIRLAGSYSGIKSTINIVSYNLVEKVCSLKKVIIRKIAHNRNTSLFFANGTNANRIINIFFSQYFESDDGENHYIHLDRSCFTKDGHLFFGILADAVLKGFNTNYDRVGFKELRIKMINNIYHFLKESGTTTYQYHSLYANWTYFPDWLMERLNDEFEEITNSKLPIFIQERQEISITYILEKKYATNTDAFSFIKNKEMRCTFWEYINMMQNNEYDRQYIIDAWGKFLGYLYYSLNKKEFFGEFEFVENIFEKIIVYGTNDLYISISNTGVIQLIVSCTKELFNKCNLLNFEMIKVMVNINTSFLKDIYGIDIEEKLANFEIDFFKRFKSNNTYLPDYVSCENFEEIAMLHNLNSKVMPEYTKLECDYLEKVFQKKDVKILDVMCGVGRIANSLKRRGYDNIFGIDLQNHDGFYTEKDFIFINENFLQWNALDKFDYAYCLYNCYSSNEHLHDVINKLYEVTSKSGVVVIDFFNSGWRESVKSEFHKILYDKEGDKVEIFRSYNKPYESTKYIILKANKIQKEFMIDQKFLTLDEVLAMVRDKWNYLVDSSDQNTTRHNDQKIILTLSKK